MTKATVQPNDAAWSDANDTALEARLAGELARARAGDALAVLGLRAGADAAAIRAAFLAATKTFHPTRFARRGPEIVRLANELFLAIKGAYHELTRRPRRAVTAEMVAATPADATPVRSEPYKAVRTAARPPRPDSSPLATSPARATRPGLPPPAGRPAATPAATPRTRVTFQPPGTGRSPSGRPVTVTSSGAPASPGAKEADRQLAEALELCKQGRWSQARRILQQAAKNHPHDSRLRVYLHYVQGREHEELGNVTYARLEFGRALAIDPSFALARHALESLQG